MYLRQSVGCIARATSDGQMVLDLPRCVANDNIVSEMVKYGVKIKLLQTAWVLRFPGSLA